VNILYISHRIPYPPNKGEKIRTFHQIQQLAKRHTIHLCSFVDDRADLPYVSALKKYCASVEVVYRSSVATILSTATAFLQRQPLSVKLFYRKALAKVIHGRLAAERFDCVVVSCSSMVQYVSSSSNLARIIDFIDVDSEKWRSYARHQPFPLSFVYRLEAERLARYEEKTARLFDLSILSSQDESRLFRKRVSRCPVSVISNGVDLEYFSSSAVASPSIDRPIIVFTGAMDYFPNVDAVGYFCREILPLVCAVSPRAEFHIVGRNPTQEVRQLAKQSNVIVTGTVPDIRPYLAQARVAVAPFRMARGVQNKILEAMAMGVPVVGTAATFKGLAATEEDGIRIANDPSSFAQQVTTFLQGDASRREAGLQARHYVERCHRWEDQGAKLERLIEEVVRRHRQKENSVHSRDAEIAETAECRVTGVE
jgi:sugar transferase (PEP-CTERM/EpsH1 system associated)